MCYLTLQLMKKNKERIKGSHMAFTDAKEVYNRIRRDRYEENKEV